MNYYYLVASLPLLALGGEARTKEPAFRVLCREQLQTGDLAVLEDLLETGGLFSGHPFVALWRQRETRLRNAIAHARASRRGVDPAPYLRPAEGFDTYTLRAVEDAFGRTTPLEREQVLDRFRWQTLEELAAPGWFGLEAVLAYALKLRLVERWSSLDPKTGWQRIDGFVSQQATATAL
jgi:hypothetical protein